MIVLADNDVIKKLAYCDLYDEFFQAFGVSSEEIFVLNTARPVLTAPRHRRHLDDDSFGRLTAFLDAVEVITASPDADEQIALAEQQNIDTGEAVLFSIANQLKDSLLATGDKRSLESLAATADRTCQRLCKKLTGKVVCFEQILEKILDLAGFDAIRDRLIDGRDCDKVLAIVLGSGLNAPEETVREGLTSYIKDLRRRTGALLVP